MAAPNKYGLFADAWRKRTVMYPEAEALRATMCLLMAEWLEDFE